MIRQQKQRRQRTLPAFSGDRPAPRRTARKTGRYSKWTLRGHRACPACRKLGRGSVPRGGELGGHVVCKAGVLLAAQRHARLVERVSLPSQGWSAQQHQKQWKWEPRSNDVGWHKGAGKAKGKDKDHGKGKTKTKKGKDKEKHPDADAKS